MPSAKPPIIRKAAWASLLPQLAIMAVLMLAFSFFISSIYISVYLGAITYLVFSMVLERGIAHNHRKGISLSKAGNYAQAIDKYKKSYDFFCKYPWVDKYRYITLLSSSRFSYTEMALVNLAFCYTQLGNIKLAKKYYKKILKRFPNNEMAKNALNTILSFELVNLAFYYTHLGNTELAKKYYKKILKRFPNNEMAKNALDTILSLENENNN